MNILIIILLLLVDAIGTIFAWQLTFILRVESGLFANPLPIEAIRPLIWMTLFWWALFVLRGMYRTPHAISRFDEVVRCFKAIIIGLVCIFILTFDINEPITQNRFFLLHYGVLAFIFVGIGRLIIRMFQRILRRHNIDLYNAIIVGFNDVGRKLNNQLHYFPVWGFRVVGFVDQEKTEGEHLEKKILGKIEDLPIIIEKQQVQFILIAPEERAGDALINAFDYCCFKHVRFMIVADFNQMVSGLVRTIEIHGLPLVEVMPGSIPLSVRFIKRTVDIATGIIVSFLTLVLTPLIGLLIKLDTAGPVFISQKRVGRWEQEFSSFQFRSTKADEHNGEPEVTRVGRILRESYLNELPQYLNLILGQMSLVGPRPERREFVEQLKESIPLYGRRFRIRPGITGWAQVRHDNSGSLEETIEKTKYDLFYIDHISLALDLKIILATILKIAKGGER